MSSRLLRNTIFGSLAGCSSTICNFVSGLIIARQLGAHLMGEVAFMTWVANTAAVVVMFGIPFTMSKYLLDLDAKGGPEAALPLARYLLFKFAAIALLPTLLALALAFGGDAVRAHLRAISHGLGDRANLVLVGLLCFLLSVGEFARSFSRGTYKFDDLAKASVISGALQCVAALVCVTRFGVGGALAAYAIGCATLLVLLYPLRNVRAARDRIPQSNFRRYAAYRWGSEVLALFVWSRIEVIFLQYYCGATSVALFTVALTLASLAVQGPMMLTWGLLPHFVERNARSDRHGMQDAFATSTRLLAMLLLPCCFGMAAIAHSLVPLLFGAAFAPAAHVAESLVAAAAYPALCAAVGSVLLACDRSDVDFYSCLAGMVASLLLGLVLTKHVGLYGATLSRVIVQIVVSSCGIWFLHHRLKLTLPFAALGKLILSASCCALAAAVVSRLQTGPLFLVLAIGAGATTYAVCLWSFSLLEAREVDILRRLLSRIARPLLAPLSADRSIG